MPLQYLPPSLSLVLIFTAGCRMRKAQQQIAAAATNARSYRRTHHRVGVPHHQHTSAGIPKRRYINDQLEFERDWKFASCEFVRNLVVLRSRETWTCVNRKPGCRCWAKKMMKMMMTCDRFVVVVLLLQSALMMQGRSSVWCVSWDLSNVDLYSANLNNEKRVNGFGNLTRRE